MRKYGPKGARLLKNTVLAAASLAMALSVAPVFGFFEQDTGTDDGGGGDSIWTVTCSYDEFDRYLGKTCTSGGNAECKCP